jgi:hypothetical protein
MPAASYAKVRVVIEFNDMLVLDSNLGDTINNVLAKIQIVPSGEAGSTWKVVSVAVERK